MNPTIRKSMVKIIMSNREYIKMFQGAADPAIKDGVRQAKESLAIYTKMLKG